MTVEELMELVNQYGIQCVMYGKHTFAFSLTRAAEDRYAVENALTGAEQARTSLENALTHILEKHHVDG